MPSCAVATCKNTHKNSRQKEIILHSFPQNNVQLSKEWVHRCRRKDFVNVKNARICSEHFLISDYEDDMKNRLLGLPLKKVLKPFAVPHVNLPSLNSEQITPRAERQKKRKILQDAQDRLENLSPKKLYIDPEENGISYTDMNASNDYENKLEECGSCNELRQQNKALKDELFCTKKMLSILKKSSKISLQKLKRIELRKKSHLSEIRELKRKLKKLDEENKGLNNIKTSMSNFLTKAQINALSKKKVIKWSSEDISKCIVLRALSSKAYDFWREKMSMPLPSASTLKRWCSKFTCSPGILHDVLLLMKKNCEHLDEKEKLCVISFDEIHIDSKLCYDSRLDQILGPFKKAQFVLARGLISP